MRRYRSVSKTSVVDESLFGFKSSSKNVSKTVHKDRSGSRSSPAAVIAASELLRMKNDGPRDEIHDQTTRESRIRANKEKLLSLEEERKKKGLMSVEGDDEKRGVIQQAQEKRDGNLMELKRINQILLHTEVAAARENQLKTQKKIIDAQMEADCQLDRMMEDERQQAIKMYNIREQQRLEQLRDGANIIVKQMEDNQKQRLYNEELRNISYIYIH
eukprot:GHVL01017155.1.p1 GENE.GHVL01017155.1~~GHVL01017155.1.p1  ORF type:complete len:216 (+),score=51.05 GHVL01017155.1:162-809(+)